jgi:hypothetical protein
MLLAPERLAFIRLSIALRAQLRTLAPRRLGLRAPLGEPLPPRHHALLAAGEPRLRLLQLLPQRARLLVLLLERGLQLARLLAEGRVALRLRVELLRARLLRVQPLQRRLGRLHLGVHPIGLCALGRRLLAPLL